MSPQEELTRRMQTMARELRQEMINNGATEAMFAEEIAVNETDTGVEIVFFADAKPKKVSRRGSQSKSDRADTQSSS